MKNKNIITFKKYYKNYLKLHKNKWCRRFHFLGQLATIFFIIFCFFKKSYLLLIFTPFIVYPFAWAGHYFFEKNKPAAFKNPLMAKLSDWIMFKDIIIGKIKL